MRAFYPPWGPPGNDRPDLARAVEQGVANRKSPTAKEAAIPLLPLIFWCGALAHGLSPAMPAGRPPTFIRTTGYLYVEAFPIIKLAGLFDRLPAGDRPGGDKTPFTVP